MSLQGKLSHWPHFDSSQIDAATRVLASGQVNVWTGSETNAFEQDLRLGVAAVRPLRWLTGLWHSLPHTWL